MHGRKQIAFLFINLITAFMLMACDRSVGSYGVNFGPNNNNSNDNNENSNLSNTNQNDNLNNTNQNTNNNEPDYLTRRTMIINTTNEIMGYQLDLGPCIENYTDIDGQSGHDTVDQFTCWALQVMHKRADHENMPNGEFGPEQELVKGGVWTILTHTLGFPFYKNTCGASDLMVDEWYIEYAGSLCEKGMLEVDANGLSHPGEKMLMAEWYAMMADLHAYFNQPSTRQYVVEAALTILFRTALEDTCESLYYDDVQSDTLLCSVTDALVDKGVLDPSQFNFRPTDSASWSDVIMLAAKAAGIPESQCNGCSGLTLEHWACGWADAICGAGYLPDTFSANEVPTLLEAYQLFWNLQMAQVPDYPSN